MTGFDLSTATNITIGGTQASAVYLGNNLIWPTNHDYSQDYLTFTAINSGTFMFKYNNEYSNGSISYSIDNGLTWNTLASEVSTPTVSAGNKILWKGAFNVTAGNYDNLGMFGSTTRFNVEGNIMSLLYGDNFIGQTSLIDGNIFMEMFKQSYAVSAKHLVLPSTSLTRSCYDSMFQYCTYLTSAPELPATQLNEGCYRLMFDGCTSLYDIPTILPATTLAQACYIDMFRNCSSLTTAPALPATTLAEQCYLGMFSQCALLTTAPELPATTLAQACYMDMFQECFNLNYVKMMSTDITPYNCVFDMLDNVAMYGTFVKNINATWNNEDLIPSGWTVQTASS